MLDLKNDLERERKENDLVIISASGMFKRRPVSKKKRKDSKLRIIVDLGSLLTSINFL